jgi:hypothetical protein
MNESEYQNAFPDTVAQSVADLPWLSGSLFFRGVPLRYEIGKTKSRKDLEMPDSITDFIELDAQNRFHLWEMKMLGCDEFQKGKVVGQMLFYDWLFKTDEQKTWQSLEPIKSQSDDIKSRLNAAELRFHSWNIAVCGGEGWELAAGINPHAWTYSIINDDYLQDSAPKISIYHLFDISTGLALRNLWQLSVNSVQQMHPESLEKCANAGFDFSDTSPTEIPMKTMLRLIGRSGPGKQSKEIAS